MSACTEPAVIKAARDLSGDALTRIDVLEEALSLYATSSTRYVALDRAYTSFKRKRNRYAKARAAAVYKVMLESFDIGGF